jgi:hypothetical protein
VRGHPWSPFGYDDRAHPLLGGYFRVTDAIDDIGVRLGGIGDIALEAVDYIFIASLIEADPGLHPGAVGPHLGFGHANGADLAPIDDPLQIAVANLWRGIAVQGIGAAQGGGDGGLEGIVDRRSLLGKEGGMGQPRPAETALIAFREHQLEITCFAQ